MERDTAAKSGAITPRAGRGLLMRHIEYNKSMKMQLNKEKSQSPTTKEMGKSREIVEPFPTKFEFSEEVSLLPEELVDVPLGELLDLKDEVGSAAYDEAVFGSSTVEPIGTPFKRENRKRPREMSSKRPVSSLRYVMKRDRKERRDPRFDSEAGEFDGDMFNRDYGFIKELRTDDKKRLNDELRCTANEFKTAKIKSAIKSLDDQEKTERAIKTAKLQFKDLRKKNDERIKKGQQPYYAKKSELKQEKLNAKLEKLKKKGKLQSYLKKIEFKKSKLERREFESLLS